MKADRGAACKGLPLQARIRTPMAFIPVLLLSLLLLEGRGQASSVPELLVDIIVSRNLAVRQLSLEEESYRGEEGILRIRPEVGKALGLRVSMGESYLKAKALLQDAEQHLRRAKQAMRTGKDEARPGAHAQAIAEGFLSYKEKTLEANALLRDYAGSLNPANDERLDRKRCSELMTRLLEKSLERTGQRLRDALGCFENTCRGERSDDCLTPQNVRFVNAVYREFVERSPDDLLVRFDLDRLNPGRAKDLAPGWTEGAGSEAAPIASLVDDALRRLGREEALTVDPLLFLALIRRESRFDPQAISHMGAAGLTQIMPKTAEEMGMEDVFHPDYFEQAFALHREEREARHEARDALFSITPENREEMSVRARKRMQESLRLKWQKRRLFEKYREELRKRPSDPRLQPEKAVEYGLRYFNELLRAQKGDISLALASYNAGPHRVRQYEGIPPYGETVRFRNRVLEFYREYVKRLGGS